LISAHLDHCAILEDNRCDERAYHPLMCAYAAAGQRAETSALFSTILHGEPLPADLQDLQSTTWRWCQHAPYVLRIKQRKIIIESPSAGMHVRLTRA
jgi:hypothetical protein